MHVDQCVRRASDRRLDAGAARESLRQGGLAGAEIALQIEDRGLLETGRTCRREPGAERFGLVRGL